MTSSIALMVLLFSTNSASPSPNLCDESVILNADGSPRADSLGSTLSLLCEWSGPDVPVWADDVCCATNDGETHCEPTTSRDCPAALELYYCEFGELIGNQVVCYQPFPSACDQGFCGGSGGDNALPDEQADAICCFNGNCYPWDDKHVEDCDGQYLWCNAGYSKEDGTVDCYD